MECSSCGEKFIEQENFDKHLQSEKHKKNMLKTQERQDDSSVASENIVSSNSKDDGVINSSVCNVSFNSLDSFQNHVTTPEHAVKVMLKQATSTGTLSSNISNQQLKCNVESTTEESILPELNDNQSYMSSYGSCKVCSKLFSGPEPYKQHLESQAHKKKVALLQNQTCIQDILKCEPCNKSFSGQVPYAQHMASETHKRKLLNIQSVENYLSGRGASNFSTGESKVDGKRDENKLWFCNICNIQCSGMAPYEQHMAGGTHLKNERRMQFQNEFSTMNGGMTSMMPISNFNSGMNSEKSEAGTQLMNGNYLIDNDKNLSNSVKTDVMKSMMQVTNSNDSKILEKSESMSRVVNNGSYQKEKGCDFVFPEKFNELVVSSDELGELIKIISPDEKIDFNELDKSKDSASENPDVIKESENHSDDEFKNIQSNLDDGLKKTKVYQICKFCNMSLYDKESAAEHFESKEHFEKRWGVKM